MRHFPIVLCASALVSGYAYAGAPNSLIFTFDVTAPCNAGGCGTSVHPTDTVLNLGASAFTFGNGTGSRSLNFISQIESGTPVVCDEVAPGPGNGLGASSLQDVAISYTNASPGGQLEFNAGGPSVVDLGAISYFGATPAGVAASYANYGATLPPQVMCYSIAQVGSSKVSQASGPSGIFAGNFESGHFSDEPWVSVQTVVSPQGVAAKAAPGRLSSYAVISSVTPPDAMGYVVEIHNASHALGWHLDIGYDYALFDPAVNMRGNAPQWCILGSGIPQPGPITGTAAACGNASQTHTFGSSDIQPGKNSIFVYVENDSSPQAIPAWSTLSSGIIPAVAAIFPPFGTYPQRFDDKVAVAHANNVPTMNIGNIVCANNASATSCTLSDQDGRALPAALTFANTLGSGSAHMDPVAYFVDPTGNSTLPGNANADTVSVSNVSCVDPNGILAGGLSGANFATSTSAKGGVALNLAFTPAGGLFTAGTAACTAKFTASGYAPSLSMVGTFTVTMQQATATHFAVTAPASATAGTSFNTLTVSALDDGNNLVASYNGTVHFSSTDPFAVLPASSALSGGTGTFTATFKTAATQSISAQDNVNGVNGTSNDVNVSPGAATHFKVQTPNSVTAGNAFNFAVTALDAYSNVDDNYAGTVHFTSTDLAPTLPADSALTFGLGSFNATLTATGPQTITATDTVNASLTGTSSAINVQ